MSGNGKAEVLPSRVNDVLVHALERLGLEPVVSDLMRADAFPRLLNQVLDEIIRRIESLPSENK